jgi:mono/diheme cytochrome c family protein
MKSAPHPFRFHPDLAPHIPSKFGCTICHGGQGLATDRENAHGQVAFWQEPLLPKDYIRASCGRCHKEGDVPGVPELAQGRRLFETHGCRGCHKLNGVGGSIGPDLTEEGAKRRYPHWLEHHFLEPNTVSPNSPMPNFHFTREQARALTFYMLSLTSEQMGSYYTSVRVIPSATYGRRLFVEKNCIVCHSIGGVGAKGGPDLLGVTKLHSIGWLDEQLVNPDLRHGAECEESDRRLPGCGHRRRCPVDPLRAAQGANRQRRCDRSGPTELRPFWLRGLSRPGTPGWSAKPQQPGR